MKSAFVNLEPVKAVECTPEWIELRRGIIRSCGFLVRAGARNTIELRSQTPVEQLAGHDRLKLNPWVPLILPDQARHFASPADRDAVLEQLTKETP